MFFFAPFGSCLFEHYPQLTLRAEIFRHFRAGFMVHIQGDTQANGRMFPTSLQKTVVFQTGNLLVYEHSA
jgi:hypothetical protein